MMSISIKHFDTRLTQHHQPLISISQRIFVFKGMFFKEINLLQILMTLNLHFILGYKN